MTKSHNRAMHKFTNYVPLVSKMLHTKFQKNWKGKYQYEVKNVQFSTYNDRHWPIAIGHLGDSDDLKCLLHTPTSSVEVKPGCCIEPVRSLSRPKIQLKNNQNYRVSWIKMYKYMYAGFSLGVRDGRFLSPYFTQNCQLLSIAKTKKLC